MIKENTLGDTKKLSLTLWAVESLHLENCKMEWKTESLIRIKSPRIKKRKIEDI